ncbi:MAG: hypothetical protein RR951_01200 [Ruthenibacterium sp.]
MQIVPPQDKAKGILAFARMPFAFYKKSAKPAGAAVARFEQRSNVNAHYDQAVS